MSDTSGAYGSNPGPQWGGNLVDLISTLKGSGQSLAGVLLALGNSFPQATASASPVMTGVNNLGSTAVSVVAARTSRHGIVFHNPATANVVAYVYASNMTTAPTLAAPGGALEILPGASFPFPSVGYANINTGFSAFVNTAISTGVLTIIEFL